METLSFELDKEGKIGVTLKTFANLREMDEFMRQFHDSNDVREYFITEINSFLATKEAIDFLNHPSKDGRARNGYITCYHEYNYHRMRKIGALYDNELITERIFTTLREALQNDQVLKDIYDRKYFLLPSQFSKDELRRIVKEHGGKKAFIEDFIRYIHNLDSESQYVYFRSLCDVCNLLVRPKERTAVRLTIVAAENLDGETVYTLYNPGDIEYVIPDEINYEVSPDAPEYFIYVFNNAIITNNYEFLFSEFTHEEIDLYSNFYRKGRRK